MNKKLLLAMSVGLMMYGVSCSTTPKKACMPGDVEAVKEMKQAGFGGLNDSQYLLLAAEYGRLECCRYRIETGADVNAKDEDGRTVLHKAAENGNAELCKYLIGLGLDVNAGSKDGTTVLHYAAHSGKVDLCKYLIGLGLDVNAKDNVGATVLHYAAWGGNVDP